MLQPNLLPLITFMFWSWWTLKDAVSDPQTNLITQECTPISILVLANSSIIKDDVNATFQDIRRQILTQKRHFATAQKADGENPVYTLFQCRNYLSVADCIDCFDAAVLQFRNCSPRGAFVVYDDCYLRYETSAFFDQTTGPFDAKSCGNQSTGEVTTTTSIVNQVLLNLQIATPKTQGFFAATKTQVPNNGANIYAFAQCIETITPSSCLACLKNGYSNMQTCLPNSDGRVYTNGCFMRYSTTSFFLDNQTIGITPFIKQGSSNKGAIIGGVVGGVILVLILLALFAYTRQPKRLPSGHITRARKLKGLVIYSYKDLKSATDNFSEENKLGEGGFGSVYKGILKNGKIVAVKMLTLQHSERMEEDFESEVKLISDVHHPHLVQLLGCCSKGHIRILVYQYMKNRSLDKFLYGEKKGYLNWKQRYDIILGTARGLNYLHEQFYVRIIHRDIKTNNILLDDNLQPKIADFGLAKLLPDDKSHLTTKFAGTL